MADSMMSQNAPVKPIKPCPKCGRMPKKWQGHAKYDLHPEIEGSVNYYVACPNDPEIMGQGKLQSVALTNYERAVTYYKIDHEPPRFMREPLGERKSA